MSCSNTKYFLERNHVPYNPKRITPIQGWISYTEPSDELNFIIIKKLLRFISGVHNHYRYTPMMLYIDFSRVRTIDKLTMQVLESVIYSLIVDYGHRVVINIHIDKQIHSEGFAYTPLYYLGRKNYDAVKFKQAYEGNTQINHYRKVVPVEWTYEGKLGEYILPDVIQTISNTVADDSFCFALAEVVTELINNANEHNNSDCLFDLDISNGYRKVNDPEGLYVGVNLSVISFSEKDITTDLSKKIESGKYEGARYRLVANAYEKHKDFFNENYTPRDFFMTAAFQNRISGRENDNDSGGTGLTKLIQSLEEYSDSHECYMVSNDRAMYFVHDLLEYDSNGYVGFNYEKDFHNNPPNSDIFITSPIIIPGIAYNLSFVYKKGVDKA